MTKERIQHLKDVIFTSDTLGSKDKTVKITHEEAKEFFRLLSENTITKEEIAKKINQFKNERTAQYERMQFHKQYINGFTQGLNDGFNLSLECIESENERI